jgi:hypothetical protein
MANAILRAGQEKAGLLVGDLVPFTWCTHMCERRERRESCGGVVKLLLLRWSLLVVPPSGPAPPPLHCCYIYLVLSLPFFIEITFHVLYAVLLAYAFFIEMFDWRLIRVHMKLVRLIFMFPMLLTSDFFYLEA